MSFGVLTFLPITSIKKVGAGFYKLIYGVVFGLLLIGTILIYAKEVVPGHITEILYVVISLLTLFFLSFIFNRENRHILALGMYCIQVALSVFLGYLVFGKNVQEFLYYVVSSLYIGVTVYAMCLGHWYLVTPKLSERPLLVSLKFFSLFFLVKLVVSGFSLVPFLQLDLYSYLGNDLTFTALIIIMRYLWGYVVLGVLAFVGWKLVRIRSLQSATGILYVMVFFIFIGELIAIYLFYRYNLLL